MSTSKLLRRFLLPGLLLGALVSVLAWEPADAPPAWQAQVTSSTAATGSGSSTTSLTSTPSSAASMDCSPCLAGSCSICQTGKKCQASPDYPGQYRCMNEGQGTAGWQDCCDGTAEVPSSFSSTPAGTGSSQATAQSSAGGGQSSVALPAASSSSANFTPNGSVIGLEAGLCTQVKPDPVTGEKLVYCCLDEGLIYQREASGEEFQQFVELLKRLETMNAKDARPIFEAPYDDSIHRKYNWTSLCGNRIPCDVCSQDHICGNGVVEATEQCDDGPRNSDATPDTCRLDCQPPSCGDTVIDVRKNEECDDGRFNGNQPNRCRTDCRLPACGDGIIDSLSGETCDAGAENSDSEPNHCRTACQSPRCGDQVKDSNEACDDGNRDDGDGCSFSCQRENQQTSSAPITGLPSVRCGNGILEPGEECDTGSNNANVPNSCRQHCALPRCGDRIQDAGEECDDGNDANGDGCDAQCVRALVLSLTNVCGNQSIDPGEECDAGGGNANIPDHCRFDCRFPFCGDGIKDTHEQCDDRNPLDGDGCTQSCYSEFCGDGILEMGEECDDGNLISGDGCSRLCQRDTGTPASALVIETGSLVAWASGSSLRGAASSVTEASQTPSSSDALNAQVIPFPTAGSEPLFPFPASTSTPLSTYYYPQQQPTFTTSSLNDTGPAALSIVAMGAVAGLAWARRKRRK